MATYVTGDMTTREGLSFKAKIQEISTHTEISPEAVLDAIVQEFERSGFDQDSVCNWIWINLKSKGYANALERYLIKQKKSGAKGQGIV